MFQKNRYSKQPTLLNDVNNLPERTLKLLKNSWADTFRREIFLRIPEEKFAVLYDKDPSRPNVAVNILVGLDILKEGKGWSDEEMYEHFLFDLQVRYALGCDSYGVGDFDLRTVYNFRKRVSKYALEKGENLFKAVFEQVTDEQIEKMGVKTDMQRMDSGQLLSNIADRSRLELLIEAFQRLERILSEEDKERYGEIFEPYTKQSAGQYAYRIKGKDAVREHIEKVGVVLYDVLNKMAEKYEKDAVYQVAQRFFDENFTLVETEVKAKTNQEIKSDCLQSFDDLEASYRVKSNRAYKGYVGNLSETCNPENPLQLIVYGDVAPNRTADTHLIVQALPELEKRTDLEEMITDGGFVGPTVDQEMRERGINHIASALTGDLPHHEEGKLAFSDFEMELDAKGLVLQATCPGNQSAQVTYMESGKSSTLDFNFAACLLCPFYQKDQCPVKLNQKKERARLNVPFDRALSSQRRRRFEQNKQEARNLRTAVEGTVYQVKHSLQDGHLRVRGLFRVTTVFLFSCMAANMRRIYRYENNKQRGKLTAKKAREASFPFWGLLKSLFCPALQPIAAPAQLFSR